MLFRLIRSRSLSLEVNKLGKNNILMNECGRVIDSRDSYKNVFVIERRTFYLFVELGMSGRKQKPTTSL